MMQLCPIHLHVISLVALIIEHCHGPTSSTTSTATSSSTTTSSSRHGRCMDGATQVW